MKKWLNVFHYLLQYPFVLLGGYYVYKAIFELGDNLWGDLNLCFTFLGVALSFLGLADTSKNIERSKKIIGKEKLIKGILIYRSCLKMICMFF